MARRRVHYVLSTHWDREWYQTFQDYRYRLVQLLDHVLEGLESGELKGPFTTDGQAIILEDYLEVRPERRAQIERLAQERKLVIGPWYVLPDEFLVSGESLIRNLRLGREVARALGGTPSNAGFVCDLFGHISQLPQIFAGFGLRAGFLWRGVNHIESRHFLWRGADGTVLPCYRFGQGGYCSYAFHVRHLDKPYRPFDPKETLKDLRAFIQREATANEVDPILLFDGCDHQEWDRRVYAVLCQYMEQPDEAFEVLHSDLDTYIEEMLPQIERIRTTREGELREAGRYPRHIDSQWLIPGVLSSRVWINQANAECQTLLCHWAEPLSAFAHLAIEEEYPQGFLNVAWRWLIKNHPHDSISGCSIDAVHEDMKFRFSQSRQIGQRLRIEAARKLAANIQGELQDGELRVVVFNPLPRALSETVELTLQIPSDWPTFNEFFGYEPKPAFRIYNANGEEIPYQRLAQAMGRTKKRIRPTHFPEAYRTNDVTVSLPLHLPPMGYTTLTVRRGEEGLPTRHPETPGLATSERSMANELLEVTIEANGSLTILDKRNGQKYSRLLTFEDVADIGDGWYHGIAVNDQCFVSSASRAEVALVHNGPMLTTFRVRTTLLVPHHFDFASMTRSEELAELVIDNLISLRPGSDRLEIETTVHNTIEDHRLRVLFPTGAQAQTFLTDTPFDVVERAIALPKDNHLYQELTVETNPQQSWTAIYDGQRGLAVISTGLMETAVRDLPERPIALTLLRSTRRTVMTDGEPNGLLLGDFHFRYWLIPLAGEPDRTRLFTLGHQLAAGLHTAQLLSADIALHRSTGNLPPELSFLALEGLAVLTSARLVDGALEVRLFNPTSDTIEATLHLGDLPGKRIPFTQVQPVNLESHPLEEPRRLQGTQFPIELGPKKILTLRFS